MRREFADSKVSECLAQQFLFGSESKIHRFRSPKGSNMNHVVNALWVRRQLISFALNSPAYSTTIRYVRKPAQDLSARSSRRDPLPETSAAKLPTLVKSPPSGPQWIHEIKYDG